MGYDVSYHPWAPIVDMGSVSHEPSARIDMPQQHLSKLGIRAYTLSRIAS
jgi:hypothetical protein